MWYDVGAVRCRLEVYGGGGNIIMVVLYVCEEDICGVHDE